MGIDSETEGVVDSSESSVVSEGATNELSEGHERGCCCWCCGACFDAALDQRPRAREWSRMTGAALGGVIGRRPLATRRAAGRPRGRLLGGRASEVVEGLVERRRRWEWLRVMKIADSSSSSLSEEESDVDSISSSSPWVYDKTDSLSLSSEKTLFCSSTL